MDATNLLCTFVSECKNVMADNNIDLKSIRQLLGMNFFVPSYQRGYRWTIQQVEELLEDVKDFCCSPTSFYCLQPIVVREMSDAEINELKLKARNDGKWYEVIDGQQRLTTILLILNVYKNALNRNDLPTEFYGLEFERERNLKKKSLDGIESLDAVDASSIDRLHVSQAIAYIRNWEGENHNFAYRLYNAFLDFNPDPCNPQNDLANNVRVIWYESMEKDPVAVFTRLNIGKISLTNAELVKALILNRSNFKLDNDGEVLRLRQQEIASEWDVIETTLQDNTFWMFLHDENYDRPTRIDFIFDLIRQQNALQLGGNELAQVGTDQYQTFRYFYAYFKNKGNVDIEFCWGKVKQYFQAFCEWYSDSELYHYIGYLLVYSSPSLNDLVKKWQNSANKLAFRKYLKTQIKSKINKCPSLDFDYKLDGSDKRKCKSILLFHNIQTAINLNKNRGAKTVSMAYRFPFDAFKTEGWDVEHINSNTTNPEDDESTCREWMLNVYMSLSEELQKSVNVYFDIPKPTEDQTKEIFDKVKSYIPGLDNWTQQEKNRLWNYVLLDSRTNRSYGNAIFSAKRRIIIGKDSGKAVAVPQLKRDGTIELKMPLNGESCFVPPVTKQVFLKYFSPTVSNNNYWDLQIDAPAYLEDIKRCIKQLDE